MNQGNTGSSSIGFPSFSACTVRGHSRNHSIRKKESIKNMLRFALQLLKKLMARDWDKIWASWRWIYSYVKKYWLQIVIYTLLGLFGTVFGLAGTVVSKNLIDAVTGFNSDSIGWAFALYIGFGVSRIFINILTGKISLLIRTKVQNEIQANIFDQVMFTDWESLSEYSTGDLLMRSSGDSGAISSSVLNFIPSAVTTIANFVGAFVIVCYHDPIMALIALAGAPVTFLTSRYRLSKMTEFQRENQQMGSTRMSFNQETYQNIQSIKAFGLIEQFSERMRQIQSDILALSLRQYRYQSFSTIIMSITALAVSYGCYGFAVFRLWQGDISYGTMTLFVSMSSSLTGSFSSIVSLVPTAISAATSAERIMEIITLPRESYADEKKAQKIREKAHASGVYVKLSDVGFSYKDGRNVYEHASLEANPGEIVALVGPSGQGKTTTLRLLLGLLGRKEGQMRIGNPGGASLEISPSTRCLFSYVPQGNTMFSGTIADNLRMVKTQATDEEITEALKAACAWSFVSKLEQGINTKIGERGLGFSEGQNQRLSIARALLADAPVLLLDEATSALDMETEEAVLKNIIRRDPHRTVIVAAHRPSVFSMCTRVYRIAGHGVALCEKPPEVAAEA